MTSFVSVNDRSKKPLLSAASFGASVSGLLGQLFLSLGLLTTLSAQTTEPANRSVSEPEFAEVFYRLDAGKLVPLEREAATIKGKASGFIVMRMKGVLAFPGARSPVRFRTGEALDFVVRSQFVASAIDPTTLYWLRKVVTRGNNREVVVTTGHASPLGASINTTPTEGILPVQFARYGNSSYRMSTPALPPGEYVVSRARSQAVFCFGVDYGAAALEVKPGAEGIAEEPRGIIVRFISTPSEAEVFVDAGYWGATPIPSVGEPAHDPR